MDENEQEVVTQENDTEITENQEEKSQDKSQESTESVDDLKKKLATAVAQKEHWRTKAEKKESSVSKENAISTNDLLVLARADVHDDDMEKVINFAKANNITIKEALKNEDLTVLRNNWSEKRKSAEVANAGTARAGQQKPTDDAVVTATFKEGVIPDKGSESAEQLFWARRGGRR